MSAPASPTRLRHTILAVLVLAASMGGCGRNRDYLTARSGAIPLQITNHHYLDITIYAVHDGQRSRVGVAGGSGSTTILLPARLIGLGGQLQLVGDPIGSADERAVTEVIIVQPGQFIQWLLEAGLARSSVAVY